MHRITIMLALIIFTSCSKPPSPRFERVQIVPHGSSDWFLGWSQVSHAQVNGKPVDTSQPLIISGTSEHVVSYGDRTLTVPMRAKDPCRTKRVVLLGDGRASVDELGPSAYWPGILREVYREQPELILNSGDLVKNGTSQTEWDNFLRNTPEIPPMVVVRGNHDRGQIFDRLQLVPGPVFWFRIGAALVVGVDSEIPMTSLQDTLDQIDEILNKEAATWRILLMHRPIWSQGNHGSDERGWNADWVPLIDRHQIDMVLAGHDHNYERFCRQTGTGSARRCHDDRGTVYLVSGGAATFTNPIPGVSRHVPRETKATDAEFSRVFSGSHHYVVMDISPSELSVRAQRTRTGNVRPRAIIDAFTLNKGGGRCP